MSRVSIFLFCCATLVAVPLLPRMAMADARGAAVYIVYTVPPEGVEPEAYHVSILASVLGSEAAAREALIYSYKNAANGFSAKLTPQQVEEISKQPGVLQVTPSRTLRLHPGPSKLNM